jgi:PAS domain S-box-containing protein
VWLLIGIGVAALVPLEMLAPGWWRVVGGVFVFVAITAAVVELSRASLDRIAASEARLQLQFRHMPVACMTVDRDRNITSWNPAAERIFGWTAAEIMGKSGSSLLSGGFTSEVDNIIASVLGGGVVDRQVNTNVTKDGRTITCRWANAPLVENGEITGMLSMAEDVTDELRIEQELHETRVRHHDLLDALPHHIFSLDVNDRYLALNAHSCRYFGLPEEEIVGRTAEELGAPPEIAREWRDINAQTRESGVTREFDLVIPGDEPRYEHVIIQPLRDHGGAVVGVTGISLDVTETRRAADAQRRLDEQMSHFSKMEALAALAGGIAHDFNNILSGILIHANVIERFSTEPRLARSIGSIRQAVERGSAISRQILTFARRAEVPSGSVDVARLVSEVYALVAETFPRTIRVQVARDPDLPSISGDLGQLQQALLNLCINARDSMPEGGILSIETRRVGDRVLISISDNGIGMDEETRRRIFEPFFTTKEKTKKMELGLAMVYGIVHAHGAQIEVESQPESGTTFRLYFPVGAPPEAIVPSDRSPEPLRGRRLLIIDDEPEIVIGLAMQLTEEGYLVQTAHDGADALEHLGELPDVVLMDLGMPRMGAVELIAALRKAAPNVPIVAMTGYVDPEVHAAVRNAGIAGILQKPFTSADLYGALVTALRAPEA